MWATRLRCPSEAAYPQSSPPRSRPYRHAMPPWETGCSSPDVGGDDCKNSSTIRCRLALRARQHRLSDGRVARGNPTPTPSEVGSRTGAPAGLSTVPRFQSPPRRTQHADFPHCAPPFASLQGLWDLSGWSSFRSVASHSIAVEQPESVVQPRPIPPLPAEALSFPSMRQMAPDLLFHPIFDEAEALTGVSNREVVHAPPELP